MLTSDTGVMRNFCTKHSAGANADHLYGLAAECGLKRLMMVFGMEVNLSGSPMSKEDKKHVNGVWKCFESYRSGRPQGTGYALPAENPFHDWDVSDRYAHQFNFSQSRTQSHQAGVRVVCGLIKKAQLEGLIMTTFDQIVPIAIEALNAHSEVVAQLDWLLINRDLNGRVRFIVPDSIAANHAQHEQIKNLYRSLAERVERYPPHVLA